MKAGDKARVRLVGHTDWVEGVLTIVSANQRALAFATDAGLPLEASGIDMRSGRQVLILTWEDGAYRELSSEAAYEVEGWV